MDSLQRQGQSVSQSVWWLCVLPPACACTCHIARVLLHASLMLFMCCTAFQIDLKNPQHIFVIFIDIGSLLSSTVAHQYPLTSSLICLSLPVAACPTWPVLLACRCQRCHSIICLVIVE